MTANPSSLVQRNGFFSPLARAIALAPGRLDGASAVAWAQWLGANAASLGVKQDEIVWTGIEDYLTLQKRQSLRRADLVKFLRDEGVRVDTVVLGDITEFDDLSDDQLRKEYSRILGVEAKGAVQLMSRDELLDELEGRVDDHASDSPYRAYTMPGSKNYRDVLLKLPDAPRKARFDVVNRKYKSILKKADSHEEAARWLELNQGMPAARGAEIVEREGGQATSAQYKSSHWDEFNVLVHIRVNDRTDVDGKRVLFIEEIQSDWGAIARATRQAEARGAANQSAVPDAPFVTKTESWLNLALKRIVMLAVDGGYDRVAFIRGDQVAERFDNTDPIAEVLYEISDEGKVEVFAYAANGDEIIHEDEIPFSRVRQLLGSDLASRIFAGEGDLKEPGDWVVYQEDRLVFRGSSRAAADDYATSCGGAARVTQESAGYRNWRKLTGLDLKPRELGLVAFYDRIVVQALNKLLPALGGQKLTSFGIKCGLDYQLPGISAPGIGMEFPGEIVRAPVFPQPGFDVTPRMRESVMAGVPLFSMRDHGREAGVLNLPQRMRCG